MFDQEETGVVFVEAMTSTLNVSNIIYNIRMNSDPIVPACVQVVDSHTAGEPTRVVVDGGPDLGSGDLMKKLQILRAQYDAFRASIIAEQRV